MFKGLNDLDYLNQNKFRVGDKGYGWKIKLTINKQTALWSSDWVDQWEQYFHSAPTFQRKIKYYSELELKKELLVILNRINQKQKTGENINAFVENRNFKLMHFQMSQGENQKRDLYSRINLFLISQNSAPKICYNFDTLITRL